MSPDIVESSAGTAAGPGSNLWNAPQRSALEHTVLVRHQLEEQFENLEQQHEAATFGMWVFLATEVLFFGVLFLGVGVYHYLYPEAFSTASSKLNWIIGGVNTLVLLASSYSIVMAVHHASHGDQRLLVRYLWITAALAGLFLVFKGIEYYEDYQEYLIPGWRFDDEAWVREEGLSPEHVPHVKLFLLFYWIMTLLHGLHVIIGIAAVTVMALLAKRGLFNSKYYSPVDVTALYWHFVDVVWIFLLPTLYLAGTHGH